MTEDEALTDWLARLESRAPASRIGLGLDRVRTVWQRMEAELAMPVITVAGTNGKGSIVAMIESMLLAGGYRPFAYTSPHFLRFSERMRIAGREAGANALIEALDQVEAARGEVDLTYFEHVTLAAFHLAWQAKADAAILEVGLGGRLDAVNVIDPDMAVIASIDVDHADYLGDTRAKIAVEKAGIARSGRPLVIGEPDWPDGLEATLRASGARVIAISDRLRQASGEGMELKLSSGTRQLPLPALEGQWQQGNAACAVIALDELHARLPLSERQMATGLEATRLMGRFQRVQDHPQLILDVAHNPAAAASLARALGPCSGRSTAVFSALADKDVAAIARAVDACFSRWLIAPLAGDRGQSAADIVGALARAPVSGSIETLESVTAALQHALADSEPDDRVVVFGSFLTVAEAWLELAPNTGQRGSLS